MLYGAATVIDHRNFMLKIPSLSKKNRTELIDYLSQAGSWSNDRNETLWRSQKLAWIIATIAIFIAFCEAVALIVMLPLKTVVPYTLLVDKQTGYVQQLKPLEQQSVAGDKTLTQSFLVQYVMARENFDIDALQADYRKVALWSSGPARTRYLASVQASNPESPLASLPRSALIKTTVKSVSQLSANTAMVRFDTIRIDETGRQAPRQPWVAIIKYRYSSAQMNIEDRYINPLGFQVLKYERNSEVIPAIEAPVKSAEFDNTGQVSVLGSDPALRDQAQKLNDARGLQKTGPSQPRASPVK
jgi:type IV secretion system protein VirB8